MASETSCETLMVQALYSYNRINNDELNFKKGDVISVLQKDKTDGWWEGSLNGERGWFPSNYVEELPDSPSLQANQQCQYKAIVLKDISDSEKAYVTELEGLVANYLLPLQKSSLLSQDEFKQLTGNIMEVLEIHRQLLLLIEAELMKSGKQQRLGGVFLQWAIKIRNCHQRYCSLHPLAVCILDIYRDELTKFMESRGASCPGILVLTTMLSKPFRRLDKYSGMLHELERHMEDDHVDREDTQKCVIIYRDIASGCTVIHRQKELELQVLTGTICGWEGPSLTTLGEITYMGLVAIESRHYYLVLFPTTLVILSVSHELSAFVYEDKLFLTGLSVNRLKDSTRCKNAFVFGSPVTENRIAVCETKEEADYWVAVLEGQRSKRPSLHSMSSQKISDSEEQSKTEVTLKQQTLNRRGYCSNIVPLQSYKHPLHFTPTYPSEDYPSAAPYAALTRYYHKLIKGKVITGKLLKRLLYSEYLNRMNLNLVRIRHHKTEVCIFTQDLPCRDSVINCDNDSDTDSSEEVDSVERRMQRQNAIHMKSGASSGSDSSNPFGYVRYYNPQNESIVEQKPPSVVVSTANISLSKQCSEESQASSDLPQPKPYMACENLSNLDGSLELTTLPIPEHYIPTSRQSCPTKFVGNKFNQSSLTTIYIPAWSNSDNNINYNDDVSVESSTHSSTLELPVNTLPIPDKMIAELLYGEFSKSVDSDMSNNTVIKGRSEDVETVNLNLSNIGFRKHSINSDKPRRRSSIHVDSVGLKRFTSSKFIQLSKPGDGGQSSRRSVCRCRSGGGYCHSLRSSDSGMEGSCTLNSPDLSNVNQSDSLQERLSFGGALKNYDKISLSEIEARNYESECRCTSPFDSTPRTSGQDSIPENVLSGSRESFTLTTSVVPSYCSLKPTDVPSVVGTCLQKSHSAGCILEDPEEDVEDVSVTYKSGLYAHWWLKADLPASVLKGVQLERPP